MTVRLKGADAERVCGEVLRQLGDRLPSDLKIKVNGCHLSTSKGPQPGRELHQKTPGRHSGTWAVFGFGTWIPLLPKKVAIKLAYLDVVETIQDFVSSESGEPWPGEGFEVRAQPAGNAVRLWFEDKSGATRPGVTLPLDLANRRA
ncbi:MAG: hypothetical protein M3Y42_06130 [Actinomycetota bacterium]|nr:hypothetical protein [Actinomycetota bacterium]MDQ2956523.1 hypothetical protein [Actinomycetota bacterium]